MFGLEVNYHSVCKYTTRPLLKFSTDRPMIQRTLYFDSRSRHCTPIAEQDERQMSRREIRMRTLFPILYVAVLFEASPARIGGQQVTLDNFCYVDHFLTTYRPLAHLLILTCDWQSKWTASKQGQTRTDSNYKHEININQHLDTLCFQFCYHLISKNPHPLVYSPVPFQLKQRPLSSL